MRSRPSTGSKRAGLNTATWNLRGQGQPLPKSPSELRDSIAIEKRLTFVVDSLAGSGTDGTNWTGWWSRSGRLPPGAAVALAGAGAAGVASFPPPGWNALPRPGPREEEAAGAAVAGRPSLPSSRRSPAWFGAIRAGVGDVAAEGVGCSPPAPNRPPWPSPGRYTVIMKIGDRTFTQPLRVDRSRNAPSR